MKNRLSQFVGILLLLLATSASAIVHYVDLNSTNATPPFTDWSTAATNIQNAVDAATNGDLILVNDGVYQNGFRTTPQSILNALDTNRVVVSKPVTIQSLNGPSATFISGSGIYRCVYLTNGAALNGFTLMSGAAGWPQPVFGRFTNTVVADGGGVLGTLFAGAVVSNCFLTGNTATGAGGGAYQVTLINCVLTSNSAASGGGSAFSGLHNCIVNSNSTLASGIGGSAPPEKGIGGGIYLGYAINCLIVGNSAFQGGGVWGAVKLAACTVVNNSAAFSGGVSPDTISLRADCYVTNCIIYFNSAGTNANYGPGISGGLVSDHSCTMPMPTNGRGNITNNPTFVGFGGGDYHPAPDSPSINAGSNTSIADTTDLDGNPRISGGTVDIGAYEFQSPGSILSYAWAQQFSLPTDGSADFTDTDGDGLNNWQEWITGTVPTNSASVLALNSPATNSPGLKVTWQSVTNRNYFLQRATDLFASPAFSSIKSNIVGQAGTTVYLDTTATNGGPYFYRVGVQ